VLPVVPPAGDKALTEGLIALGATTAAHVAMTYPNPVDLNALRLDALAFSAYQGLYRHYWDAVDLSDWDVLVIDPKGTAHRALVLASKESAPGRVVLSALPLDWQKHVAFFSNLLVYVVEGRHHLATVDGSDDPTLEYLRESLRARCIPFGRYRLPDNLSEASRNIAAGIHSTLLLGAGLGVGDLPDVLKHQVKSAVLEGRLRLIDIDAGSFGLHGMTVLSRELRPGRLLVAAEMQIQKELRSGYIDDSFWSHVETLQTLERMHDHIARYAELQSEAFAIAKNHDRSGSYDELFGPTCAYYWLRATYGTDSAGEHETGAWLRRRIHEQEPQDRALAYHVFAAVGTIRPDEREDLAAIARSLDLERLSESQLVLQLRAAVTAALPSELVAPLAEALVRRQQDGKWLDLTTTATAAHSLLDARELLDAAGPYGDLLAGIDDAVRSTVVIILRELAQAEEALEPVPYPWEGKARTTTKCLQAWMKFEARQDLPVHELIENLARADRQAARFSSSRTALATLQEISVENRKLREQLGEAHSGLNRLVSTHRRAVTAGLAVAVLLYALIAMVVGLVLGPASLADGVKSGFVNGWAFHSAVLGVVATAVGIWIPLRKRRDSSATDKHDS
jgi:hypothetical protein